MRTQGSSWKWRRPTLPRVCSTIGATVLNFSVRNGKRWNHSAITTGNILLDIFSLQVSYPCHAQGIHPTINLHKKENTVSSNPAWWNHHVSTHAGSCLQRRKDVPAWSFGQLVVLGFDVTVFTPAPYQRHRLWRPSKEISSCGRLRT